MLLKTPKTLPGEAGIWIFVFGDLLMFTLFFSLYCNARSQAPLLFERSQRALNPALGLANTLVLLSSSLFAVLAVRSAQKGHRGTMSRMIMATLACALIFATLKSVEYHEKFAHGISISTNDFFMYYFVITGLHLVHLGVGSLLLAVFYLMHRRAAPAQTMPVRSLEVITTFWHLVDLLWIVIFPLLYLMR